MIESISMVIPCYNEAATIDEFYRRVNELASSLDSESRRSLVLAIFNDGEVWSKIAEILKKTTRLPLNLARLQKVRYLMIMASGTCRLSLDEVEIYQLGPPGWH